MDARTRHQLKTNELAEALARLREFSDRRALYLFVVVAVVVLVYAGYRLHEWQSRQTLAAGWWTLATQVNTRDPTQDAPIRKLRELLDTYRDPGLHAAARLRLGVLLRRKALLTGDAQARQEAIETLQAIVDDPQTPPGFRAGALYTLGLAYEDRRDLEQARQAYERLVQGEEFAGVPYVDLARQRLESLSETTGPVALVPGFPPLDLPTPATAPATQPTRVTNVSALPAVAPTTTQPTDPPVPPASNDQP